MKKKLTSWILWFWIFILPPTVIFYFSDLHFKWLDKFKEDPIEWFTLLLFVSTALLWWETFKLRELADKQAVDMRRSLDIAEISAKAAQRSANVAERSLESLEQPFLFVYSLSRIEHNLLDTSSPAQIRFNIANYGRVPAIISSVFMSACCVPVDSEPDYPLKYDGLNDVLAVQEKVENLIYRFPSGMFDDTLSMLDPNYVTSGDLIPKIKVNEVLYLSLHITYGGILPKLYFYKVLWKYDMSENKFNLVSWNLI